ncbi:MAG: hypothetical protein NTW95_04355 [Candidatus Aminicenantes bacterium]|nr:hypothetical protein [Candidatus Aminicenantes bacterium]
MIKKRQKWIALFVTLTFMWLLQVSTMPLAAASTTEQVSSASAEQEPGYLEAVGYKAVPAKKKSILPIILIGVGVVAVAAVLFLVVFKTKYNIVGTWDITTSWSGGGGGTVTNEFVGDKKEGDVHLVLSGSSAKWGEYTVDGKEVSFSMFITTLTGEFTDKTHMSGTCVSVTSTGTWTAVKTSDTTIAPIPTSSMDRQTAERIVTNK